ncbi:MAG: carboxypeptidase-like regulatory domain-containing protein [Planctomycetota bacterium]
MREGDEPVVLDALMTMSLTIRITGDAPDLEDLWAQAVPRDRVAPSNPASAFAPGVAVAAGGGDAVLCHGALRCLDLGKGSYVVAVGRRGEGPAAFACASIVIPHGGVGLRWPDHDAEHACTVRCVPPGGRGPSMDARFHVEHPKGINTAPASLLPDGRYWVDLSIRGRRDRLGAPTRLFLDSERWGTAVVRLAEERDDYVARFEEPTTMAVRVVGGSRSTWSVLVCHVDRPQGFPSRLWRPFVDGVSGHVLQPGRYRLALRRQDSRSQDRDGTRQLHLQGTLATLEVDVDRDGLVVVFPEPELHDLDVRVPGVDAVQVTLFAQAPHDHNGMSVTDGGGDVRFPGLPAGTYTIRPGTMDPMTVQVPCEPVEYVPDRDD